jgi:restriction endonuclease S subunit
LQGSAEFGERFPSPDRWCSAPTRVAEPGDLLVSVRAPVGDTNFADTRLAIGRGLARVRTTSVASSDFVRLVIQSEVGRLNQNAGGGMFASITARNLRGFRVALPPIPEQRRIVDLIGSIDSYSDNLQTQAGATRAARSALVAELLSKLGDDWRETTLGEISTGGVFTDGDWVESKDQDPEGTNRLLQLADVGDGVFLDKSDRWMRDDQFDGLRCTSVEADDVLIARMPDPIARACLVPSGLPRSCVAVDIAICRPPREVVLPRVLVMVLNDRKFRMEAEARATGSTRKRVSRKNLSEIRFFLPPLVDQARIAEVVDAIDEQVASLDSQIASVQLVRRGVLSELLSGERFLDESYDAAVSL